MIGDPKPVFKINFGGTFETLNDGSVIYNGGLTQTIVTEARSLFLAMIHEIHVPLYRQRVWYKLPYEDIKELKILCNGSDNFDRMCEVTTWVKVIDIYMEKEENVQSRPEFEELRVNEAIICEEPRVNQVTNRKRPTEFEEEARVEAVIVEIQDDSEPEGLPTSPNCSDIEEDVNAYETWERGSGELKIRQVFTSVEAFKESILDYALKGGWDIKYARWGPKKSEAIYGVEGELRCLWRIYCSYDESINCWLVKMFYENHTCIKDGRCKLLTENIIAKLFLNELRGAPGMPPKLMQQKIEESYNLSASHDQCRKAKKKALDIIQAEYDEQYSKIKDYEIEIRNSNPGSTVDLRTMMIDGPLEVFERFYVCFAALRISWLECCRPVIGIDGCFLKNGTKGQLLAAVGRDSNNQIYPVAWAIVQVEDTNSWLWFISKLKEDLLLGNGDGFTLISDRQKGLLIAVEQLLPSVEHRMCARHIYCNIKRYHPKKGRMKRLFWDIVESYTQADYEASLQRMKEYDLGVYETLMQRNPKCCSRAFFKTKSCCEDALNNYSESYNNTLEKARSMPLVELLETMRRQAMVRIEMRREKSLRHKSKFTPRVGKLIKKEEGFRRDCRTNPGPTSFFEVVDQGTSYKINMSLTTCTCRRWDLIGIPCRHALRVVLDKKLNPENYVAKFFLTTVWQKQYRYNITPLVGVKYWISSGEPTLQAPPREVSKGRKKKPQKRIRGIYESPTKGKKVTTHGRTMHCHRCGFTGHYQSKCDNPGVPTKPPKAKKRKNLEEVLECRTLDVGEGPSQPTQEDV